MGTLRASSVALLTLLAVALGGCTGSAEEEKSGTSDDALTGLGTGTFVVEKKPTGSAYLERLTLSAGKKFEADYVSGRGGKTTIGGSYTIFPARANNPDSPVASDKPWIALESDTGPAPNFELDIAPDGGLRLYSSARQQSFTMKKDAAYVPPPTTTKTLNCTGPTIEAKLTLDRAQNRRGTLQIKRKSGATDRDPRAATMGSSIRLDDYPRDWLSYESSNDGQDFYFGIPKAELERGTGPAQVNLQWAEFGQQFGIAVDCTFER
jgi:hypothetical protein